MMLNLVTKLTSTLLSVPDDDGDDAHGRYPLKNVAEYVRLSGLLKAVPFVWIVNKNGRSSRVQLLSTWNLLLWKLVTIKTFAFFAFLLIDFYFQYPIYLQNHDILYGYLHLFWITGFFVLSAVRLHFWLRYREIIRAVNQMINLVHYLETNYCYQIGQRGKFTRTWRIFDKFMVLALISSFGCCVPYGLLVIPFERHRALFYALLPVPFQNPLIMFLMSLFNMFFISFQVAGYFVESLLHIVFIESIRNSLAVLDQHASQFKGQELILIHQKLRLLNTAYFVAFGDLGLPAFKFSISTLIIFSTVAALKFIGQVNFILITFSLFVSFVTAVAISILLLMAGKIATKSENVRRQALACASIADGRVIQGQRRDEIRMMTKSSRVIAIEIGVYYIVNKMTPLTYFTLLFTYLISILISFQTTA